MVALVKLRRVMSSIMRRRKGVMCGSFASERGGSEEPVHDAASEQRRGVRRPGVGTAPGRRGRRARWWERSDQEERPRSSGSSGSSFLPTAKRCLLARALFPIEYRSSRKRRPRLRRNPYSRTPGLETAHAKRRNRVEELLPELGTGESGALRQEGAHCHFGMSVFNSRISRFNSDDGTLSISGGGKYSPGTKR